MTVLWVLFMTLTIPQPLMEADSAYYARLCAESGGTEIWIGGNFKAHPTEPHTARLVECRGEKAEPAAEIKPNA